MNLVRLGHLYEPGDDPETGKCSTALVVHVWSDTVVNVALWDHNGNPASGRTSVMVGPPDRIIGLSFHLSADCPWKR